MDNSSSNSSTYSSHHHAAFQQASMTQSLHLPSTHHDENVILINVGRQQPSKATNLNYRKSFSHVNGRWQNDSLDRIDRAPSDTSTMMTKSLYDPSTSAHLHSRRFATLAHPKEKFEGSLSERNLNWDPILSCKIGSQSTLRTKPPVPWYELAIKKEFRQSCPPLQVIIMTFFFLF